MAVYKLNEIMKTLDKLFKYNVKTTEKVATLRWQDLDFIGDFTPFEKSLIMDLKVVIESNYNADMIMPVAYAGMICLAKLLTLSNENIGGVSQSYDTSKLTAAIKSLAASAGLSASLVLEDESEDYGVKAVQCW